MHAKEPIPDVTGSTIAVELVSHGVCGPRRNDSHVYFVHSIIRTGEKACDDLY